MLQGRIVRISQPHLYPIKRAKDCYTQLVTCITEHYLRSKGSRKNNFAELTLGFGSGLADPRE